MRRAAGRSAAQGRPRRKARWPPSAERRKESQMGDGNVLRFVHHGKVEGRCLLANAAASRVNIPASVISFRAFESAPHLLEDRPEHRPLRLRQSGLSPQPRHVAIRLPRFQLPCVHDLLPLGEQEVQAEFVAFNFLGRRVAAIRECSPASRSSAFRRATCKVSARSRRWTATSSRSARRGSLLIRRRSFVRSAFARMSENVVSSTRASGFARARKTARCSATIVFPVPAEPADTRRSAVVALHPLRCAG